MLAALEEHIRKITYFVGIAHTPEIIEEVSQPPSGPEMVIPI